jgi:HlyD family secretion protein
MDRKLEARERWTRSRLAAVAGAVLAAVVIVGLLATRSSRMTTAFVEHGEFRDYYPFDGIVEPMTTVYLDVEEGGRVEEVFVEGGHAIQEGDLILRFSNTTLRRSAIDTETQLLENLDILRNTQFNRAQSSLLLREQLLELDHRILELQKRYDRYDALGEAGRISDISQEMFETTRDELKYLRDKRDLLEQRIAQEDELSRKQLEQANESIERLNVSLGLLTRIVESLDVRAPISGFLSSIDVEVGQNVNRGERIGQIDQLDAYKIRVSVDQYYISRVEIGTPGKFELDGESYDVKVSRIYPEVVNDAFAVDVDFVGLVPATIKRGQRLVVELSFGGSVESLIVAKGGFFQGTGGRWAYLVAEDGRSARRVPIRVGRQNPRFLEVLEGLKPGDWIVSSSYETFNEVDELRFTEPIERVK